MRRASPRLFSTSPPTARLFLSVTLLRVLLSFATASEIPDWPPLLQQAYLKASNTAASNWFGFSVAISGEIAKDAGSGVDGVEISRRASSGAGAGWRGHTTARPATVANNTADAQASRSRDRETFGRN